MIRFDLRKLPWQQKLGTPSALCWRKDCYHIDMHELATFHQPLTYRFLVARGCYLNDQHQRVYFNIGAHLPAPEDMLRQLLALTPATECPLDGYYSLGTDHCVMVVKDEHDRILMTYEAASENGDDARPFLQKLKDRGLNVTAAFADYSQSFTEAIKAVWP